MGNYVEALLNDITFSGRFELFLDLLYVAIVANFADALAEHVTFAQVVKYVVGICL